MTTLQDTPRGKRLHIGIFGRRNSGKSSLLNAITGHDLAVVSDVAGTTTDPIYKSMELYGIGPVVWIDTAGVDDEGELGKMRVEKTAQALEKTDIALMVFADFPREEAEWARMLKEKKTPIVPVVNKSDILADLEGVCGAVKDLMGEDPLVVSALNKTGVSSIREALIRKLPADYDEKSLTGDLVGEGDSVLLVMPQDIQAPKGRLILPQVQTLRELLDKKCIVTCCTTDKLDEALGKLEKAPKLIITDSQVFKTVYEKKPEESLLTSFSVLMAGSIGDIEEFIKGANAIEALTEESRVLIAEACTHAPLEEDIGRVKIPRQLRKLKGEGLQIDMVSGSDFPQDLTSYDLIIHCGACMFNRKHVLSRIERARSQGVPITNYGITLAFLTGILDKIVTA
ncbi:MAG: [FeFe] hydrogenase H-cluster maturation GTPase HydF [Clostridiales bacterium]|nr:[FeFe] hydrogenase H-cluster maturation GTPase HydF [Clostridiales bacterium]